jgi:hypothetical protein
MRGLFAFAAAFFASLAGAPPRPYSPAQQESPIASLAKLQKALAYHGVLARVARELGLGKNGRSHVRRVAMGERQSARVQLALMQEVKRIERTARKEAA